MQNRFYFVIMHGSELIRLLKTFSKKEIRDFGQYIRLSHVTNRNAVRELFEIIGKYHPDYPKSELTNQKIFEELFPGKRFNGSSLRVIVYCLNELALHFIAVKNLSQDKIAFEYHKIRDLNKRNENTLGRKAINNFSRKLNSLGLNSNQLYYYRFLESDLRNSNLLALHSGGFEKILNRLNYDNTFLRLQEHYALNALQIYLIILNINTIYGKRFDTKKYEKVVSQIDKKLLKNNPVIQIFYSLIKMNTEKNSELYYETSKRLVFRFSDKLGKSDLHEAFINLENFCNRKLYGGDEKFLQEKFNIYKREIELEAYSDDAEMSPLFYKNAVYLSVRLGKLDWTIDFIEKYRKKIEGRFSEETYYHCMALYEFKMKNFEKSLIYISKIRQGEVYMNLDSRVLQIQNHYELNSTDTLMHCLESFRHYLNYEKLIPEIRKSNYRNFHKYVTRLLKFKNRKDSIDLEMLKSNAERETTLMAKNWIIESIDKALRITFSTRYV